MNSDHEKENKTLLSKDEINKAISKLTQFLDVDEEEEQDDLPEYFQKKIIQEDYVEEPLVIGNLKDIAKEIAELAFQNEELTKRIMKHQLKSQKKSHKYDNTVKRLYELNQFQQNKKAEIQFQLFQKELQELTWSPEISQYSRKLAAKNIPLHLRLGQCLETKQKNLEKIKFNMEQEKKLKIINESIPSLVIKKKDSPLKLSFEKNENLTKNGEKLKKEEMEKTWEKIKASNNKKNNFITKGQFLKLEKEVADLTLQPKINETSRRMMENKYKESEPVEDRLIKKYIEKMENKKNQSEYKIKPKSPFISKRSKKLAERYSLKKSFSPEPSKISSIESPKEKISPKVVHIEYDEKQKFLVEKIAKKLIF